LLSYISKLKLTNYRNFENLNLEFPGSSIALVGKNGVGKTNILEAISIMQPGRGIRSAKITDISHNNANFFGVFVELLLGNEKIQIGTEYNKKISRVRKIKINKNYYISQMELIKYLRIISLSPSMDGMFIDSPHSRRKFIDRITWNFYGNHSQLINSYDQLIKERNNILRENILDHGWIKNVEKQIVDFGSNILINRNEILSLLSSELENRVDHIKVFPAPDIFLSGEVEEIFGSNNVENFKEIYKEKLFNSRSLDSLKGSTGFGPHRSELSVNFKEKKIPAYLCSTGEQKILLISIILATARASKDFHGSSPILLLDEVFSHLDEVRREALSREIIDIGIQAWMTSTEASHYMTFGGKSYIINLDEIV